MSSANQRGYAWIDESIEHSEADEARASALMNKWSQLRHDEEQRTFQMQADIEDGRDAGIEPDPCETCGGTGFMVPESHPRNPRGDALQFFCEEPGCCGLTNIRCSNPNCEDGYDMADARESERARAVAEAERTLEMELIEDKLALIGARPMRPYEHWNEDEHYMQYMEEGRFGDHSR